MDNELIITIVNEGYEETVMEAARSAGARGGTVFNAHGTANAHDDEKFFGVTIHPNKEIVFILASTTNRKEIMQAIKSAAGLTTDGAGIVFSLPVESALGIGENE